MRTIFTLLFTVLITLNISAQWKPAGDKLKTKWASEIDVNNVLPEYPRPIMERTEWQNLNGLWNYAILPVGQQPSSYDGEILVPFAVESSLSGVQKRVGEDKELWYQFAIILCYKVKLICVIIYKSFYSDITFAILYTIV